VIITESRLQDVKEGFTPLVEQTNKMGLDINKKKDKICNNIAKALQ